MRGSTSKLFLGMLLSVLVAACASEAPKTAAQTSPKQPATNTTGGGSNTGTGSNTVSVGFGASLAGSVDGFRTVLYKDRNMTSLSMVDVVKATGKKVAIFQFAGVDCLECHDEAQLIEAQIAASPKGKDIAHVVVLTDFFKDYNDGEFQGFVGKFAPNAFVMYDEAKVWKKLSSNPASPNRATIVAMDANQTGVLYQNSGQEKGIVQAAEKLLP